MLKQNKDTGKKTSPIQTVMTVLGTVLCIHKIKNEDICSSELFEKIINWSDKFINRCFKTTSKEDDRIAAIIVGSE